MKHEEVKSILSGLYPKFSMNLMGRTGIGKSDIIRGFASEKGGEKFVEWNKLSLEEKKQIAYSKGENFILVDLRLSQVEPTDITGVPFPENGSCIYKKQLWVHALHNNPGVLFLDEMNLASPSVLSASYQIILDKVVGDIPLHKDVMVLTAGNLQEDRAYTFELPLPIQSRMFMYNLDVPTIEEWTSWAVENEIDSRVVTYLNRFQQMLFYEKDDLNLIITPRGWEFIGTAIKGVESFKAVEKIAQGILKGKAKEFVTFIKLIEKIPKPEDLLDKNVKFPEELDQRFITISMLTEHYRKDVKKEVLKKIFDLKDELDAEYHILLMRLVRAVDKDFFKKTIIGDTKLTEIMKGYFKYLA